MSAGRLWTEFGVHADCLMDYARNVGAAERFVQDALRAGDEQTASMLIGRALTEMRKAVRALESERYYIESRVSK